MKTNILILEDEIIIAKSIKIHLEANGFYAKIATTPEDARNLLEENRFDLILSDINLSHDIDGILFVKDFVPDRIPVVFLSAYSDLETLQKAELVMPYAYLLKPFHKEQLLLTINLALSNARKKMLPIDFTSQDATMHTELSRRELDVVRLVMQGKTSSEIADILFISKDTVATHRKNVMRKTGCKSTLELAALGLDMGWI